MYICIYAKCCLQKLLHVTTRIKVPFNSKVVRNISRDCLKLLGRVSATIGCAQVIAFGIGAQFKVHARYLKRLSRIT